ncbi:MAG: response regulator [Leptolyngbyaceae bacterium]|nr:response regulator [Leptolyngbyaceae bacterium]
MHTHILVVEDEPSLAQLLSMALEDEGYKVTIASDGVEALKKIWTFPYPDLILLDRDMPRMSGLEVCQRLRQAGFDNPIVFVTGRGDRTDCETGLKAGANGYIIKPFVDQELITMIQQLMGDRHPDVAVA